MNKQIIFWLWLQCCLGVDNPRMNTIFKSFDDAQQIYLSSEKELKLSGVFTQNEILKLNDKKLDTAKKMYNNSEMLGYDIYSLNDINYPKMLKHIPTPPVVIYIKGKLPDNNKLYTAIVGTRSSTKSGKDSAFKIAYDLAERGAIIVSGGALGIDSQAHRGAIQAGGETVCVLGCGLNYKYLPSEQALKEEIVKHGTLISEYPPNYPPTKYTFPKRNRIISGISHCTIVVEAGKTSGALITAKYAVKQYKQLFAVPGSISNPKSEGTNLLIKEGAKALTDYNDVLNWYRNNIISGNNKSPDISISEKAIQNIIDTEKKNKPLTRPPKKSNKDNYIEKKTDTNICFEQLTDNAATVYDTISDIPIHIDDIKIKTGLKINEVLIALTELEISGFIVSQSGRRYIRK